MKISNPKLNEIDLIFFGIGVFIFGLGGSCTGFGLVRAIVCFGAGTGMVVAGMVQNFKKLKKVRAEKSRMNESFPMEKLSPEESVLAGEWIPLPSINRVIGDSTEKRIDWLVRDVLVKLAISREYGAWETLYRDPDDHRLWEKTYPDGGQHGGGPARLRVITEAAARKKYDF